MSTTTESLTMLADDHEYTDTNEHGYFMPTSERLDRDYIALARGYLRIEMCPSGRPTIKGQTCSHCGVDISDDPSFCGQPVTFDGVTPMDTTIVRRILRDSADKYGE